MREKLYAVVIAQQISQVAGIQSVRISVACSWQHMVLSLLHRPCKTLSQLSLLMGTDTGLKLKYHI